MAKQLELEDRVNRPSLESLSYALRHPETWPKGFFWNYKGCWAHQLWKQIPEVRKYNIVYLMEREYVMLYEDAERIFYNANYGPPCISMHEVTPDMVANLIDKYIVRQTRETS